MVFSSLPAIVMRPYIGVLVWSWLGYMNPHRLTWGFAYNFPFSQVVAGTVLAALVFSPEPKRIPITALTVVWMLFLGWICVTTYFAMYPEAAMEMFVRIVKIQLMCFVTMMLITTHRRLDQLIWVIVFSLGFFGVKGGIFKLVTGGSAALYGPGGFIEDNNALAIALVLTIPLVNYLRMISTHKLLRWALLISMVLIGVAVISTFSRAAALGGVAMCGLIWLKSNRKLVTALALLALLPLLYVWAPDTWHERMATISEGAETGEFEASAQSRLDIWAMVLNLSKDRPVVGAGLSPWFKETYDRYAPEPEKIKKVWAAHSIYFSVLAEHGYVGLGLFLLIYLLAFRTASRIIRDCEGIPEAEWLQKLTTMLQISLGGFTVAGAFHQLPYFDLPWHLIAVIAIGRKLADQYVAAAQTAHEPEKQSGLAPSVLAPGH